jgi:mono/diheme cytochrome c family protein
MNLGGGMKISPPVCLYFCPVFASQKQREAPDLRKTDVQKGGVMRLFMILFGLLLLVAACTGSPAGQEVALEALPSGDAERGEALFSEVVNGAPACSTCHQLDDVTLVGPGLANFSDHAAGRVDGMSAEEYTYESIVKPAAHIVSGFSNAMYAQYDRQLSSQQIADLIAYLLTL